MKQHRHLTGALEVSLGVGQDPAPGFLERDAEADAAQQVVQRLLLGSVKANIVGGHHRQAKLTGDPDHGERALPIAGGQLAGQLDGEPVTEKLA